MAGKNLEEELLSKEFNKFLILSSEIVKEIKEIREFERNCTSIEQLREALIKLRDTASNLSATAAMLKYLMPDEAGQKAFESLYKIITEDVMPAISKMLTKEIPDIMLRTLAIGEEIKEGKLIIPDQATIARTLATKFVTQSGVIHLELLITTLTEIIKEALKDQT